MKEKSIALDGSRVGWASIDRDLFHVTEPRRFSELWIPNGFQQLAVYANCLLATAIPGEASATRYANARVVC